jgi:CheY-like chemotaxis protein
LLNGERENGAAWPDWVAPSAFGGRCHITPGLRRAGSCPVRAQRSRCVGESEAVLTGRVLVVEDEPAIRGLLSLLLEGEGYLVDGASDGREALIKLAGQPPDVLVVDLDLPVMNGCDLVRACRADAGLRHLPIIAISGLVGGHAVQDLDVQDVLPKPFSLDTLLNVLHGILRQRTPRRPLRGEPSSVGYHGDVGCSREPAPKGLPMASIRTLDAEEARSRLRGRSSGESVRAPYRAAIANLTASTVLEITPDPDESLRKLKRNVTLAAREVHRHVAYGVSDEGMLLVWLASRPRKARRRRTGAVGADS